MDHDTKCFIYGWGAFTVIIVTLILSVLAYNKAEVDSMNTMVKNGASPIEARCAYGLSTDTVCITYINSEEK